MLHHSINYSHYFQLHTDYQSRAGRRLLSRRQSSLCLCLSLSPPPPPLAFTFQHANPVYQKRYCTRSFSISASLALSISLSLALSLSLSLSLSLRFSRLLVGSFAATEARPAPRKFRTPFDTRLIHRERRKGRTINREEERERESGSALAVATILGI